MIEFLIAMDSKNENLTEQTRPKSHRWAIWTSTDAAYSQSVCSDGWTMGLAGEGSATATYSGVGSSQGREMLAKTMAFCSVRCGVWHLLWCLIWAGTWTRVAMSGLCNVWQAGRQAVRLTNEGSPEGVYTTQSLDDRRTLLLLVARFRRSQGSLLECA